MPTIAIPKQARGGLLLLLATVAALVLANSAASSTYEGMRDFTLGPAAWGLDLTVGQWASDGLLAIFFFVVGMELKHELLAGSLRDFRTALVPVTAAIGGVIVPATVYLIVIATTHTGVTNLQQGWAIPTATDIAFAVAVLAVVGRRLPPAVRAFLLTLAVVDDLIAIIIIAVVYASNLSLVWLIGGALSLGAFAVLAWWLNSRFQPKTRVVVSRSGLAVLLVLAVLTWCFVHASGVHATIAGVALGLAVPHSGPLAGKLIRFWEPISTSIAVPVFAFFAAGVTISGANGLGILTEPVTVAVIAGLVVGKPLGILVTTFFVTRLPALRLDPTLRWWDLAGMACVAGVGFTVSLLVSELAFHDDASAHASANIGVLLGSLVAAVAGAAIFKLRGR